MRVEIGWARFDEHGNMVERGKRIDSVTLDPPPDGSPFVFAPDFGDSPGDYLWMECVGVDDD
jgi:hypothetical protein